MPARLASHREHNLDAVDLGILSQTNGRDREATGQGAAAGLDRRYLPGLSGRHRDSRAHRLSPSGDPPGFAGPRRALCHGGDDLRPSPTITISAGTFVVSDPVRLRVPALGDLVVSIYLPGDVTATTDHDLGLQTNYLSAPGDFTGAANFTGTTTQSFHFLTTVEVRAPAGASRRHRDAGRVGHRWIRVDT